MTRRRQTKVSSCAVHFSFGDDTVMGYNDGVPFGVGNPDDLWCMFAADREVTNGSSYIDFEFLQKTLTMDPGGLFTSLGTDGGRTENDL